MKHALVLVLFGVFTSVGLGRDSCGSLAREAKLPVKLKTQGNPSRARWEQVDKVMSSLGKRLQGMDCEWTFGEIFRTGKDEEELYFPVTNNLVRQVPEGVLLGLQIFDQQGENIGEYEGRIAYERSRGVYIKEGYTLYYFQFKNNEGELQSTGNRLLLDKFLVRWDDLKDRTAISTRKP